MAGWLDGCRWYFIRRNSGHCEFCYGINVTTPMSDIRKHGIHLNFNLRASYHTTNHIELRIPNLPPYPIFIHSHSFAPVRSLRSSQTISPSHHGSQASIHTITNSSYSLSTTTHARTAPLPQQPTRPSTPHQPRRRPRHALVFVVWPGGHRPLVLGQ